MADYFSSAALGAFVYLLGGCFMMSEVMSCFPSMSFALLSTNLRAFSPVLVALVDRKLCGLIVFWI